MSNEVKASKVFVDRSNPWWYNWSDYRMNISGGIARKGILDLEKVGL